MLLLATACNETDSDGAAVADAEPATEPTPPTEPAPTEPSASESTSPADTVDDVDPAEEVEPIDAAAAEGDDPGTSTSTGSNVAESPAIACDDRLRAFDHENLLGDPICIPERPERVVPIGLTPVEVMMLTDTDFVAGTSAYASFLETTHPEWVDTFATATDGLLDVGAFQTNIEAVAAAEPDLIVATGGFVDAATTELLREIAPTIEFDSTTTGADWRSEYRFVGEAINERDAVESLIADADRRRDELADALGDGLDGQTVSVVRARPDDGLQLRLGGTSVGIMLERLGVGRPDSQQSFANPDGFVTRELSQELWLDQADGDYLFLYANQPGGANDELVDSIRRNPLWQQLDAVRKERAFVVGAHWHWPGVLAEHKVIDDLFEILAGAEPARPDLGPTPASG